MNKYTFANGDIVISRLTEKEILKRMNRLNRLRVVIEGNESEEATSIQKKAIKAWNKKVNFTGIIRLTFQEKDWLSYMLENEFLDEEDKEIIKFYCKSN